ncbi:hypothetical protein F4859DRAFT_69409 [Xylaria cf. heliscus]|nr:hypothetical protein F4859DRAFT_69409 [Xylaria cf. heliscus]
MEDRKSELLQYAREYAAAGKDLYELLSVPAEVAQPEVHRAWRKASLKHHPDKAKHFDPEIWQLFERARDVLSAPEARAAYDSARAAAVQAQKARAALDAKRRAMIDDLEARERGVKRKAGGETGQNMMTEAEKRALMEKGREHLEKRRRMREEAEARERDRDREQAAAAEEGHGTDHDAAPKEAEQQQPNPTDISMDNGTEDTDAHAPPPAADDYDERIANLERRLREHKAGKAARKAEKRKKNSHNKARTDEVSEDHNHSTTMPATNNNEKLPPSNSVPQSKPTTHPPPASNTAPGDFSSTMAKLRAAQREKERKRAEAAAAAAAAAATSVASE